MVFADKCTSAQAVVRKRNCQRATELGRNFLAGETVQYIDTNEIDFFSLFVKVQDAGKMGWSHRPQVWLEIVHCDDCKIIDIDLK